MMDPGVILICLVLIVPPTVGDRNITDEAASAEGLPFTLTYAPDVVHPGITDNVELRCEQAGSVGSGVEELLWMRIVQQAGHGWTVLAELTAGSDHAQGYGEVSSSGRLTPIKHSFLSVVWTKPTNNVVGSYKCLTFGLNKHAHFVVSETPLVNIRAKKVSEAALLDIIIDTEARFKKQISKNAKKISETAKSLDVFSHSVKQRASAVNHRLDQAHLTVESMMTDLLFPNSAELWPSGTYGLLMPEAGCPADLAFHEGNTGYFRLHTESSSLQNDNSHSQNSHLAKPIITSYSVNSFITLRFCVTNGVYNIGPWPEGRYCIHQKNGCLIGLTRGYIYFKTEAWGNLDTAGGNTPSGSPSRMDFCCRTTGNPDTPIVLPTAHPFYLYQYDGRCQQVKGMKVTEEYIQVDTEPGSSGSRYHPYLPSNTAGDTVRLELCYYTKL